MIKRFVIFLGIIFSILLSPSLSQARENVNYWYIKDFKSEILVNKDSSLDITEDIVADCGQCVGKHGIFRVLPTQIYTNEGTIKTPIKLISITDFDNRPYKYSTSKGSVIIQFPGKSAMLISLFKE